MAIGLTFGLTSSAKSVKTPTIYVDSKGIMRWSDTKHEAAFYGVNYTIPFAHAFRAMGYMHQDLKQQIDRDVYHIARMGMNAFRLHLWDVELTDSIGTLQQNVHLDALDYLISKLHQRDIRIVLTAQTNFGNGYPERNLPTGGFSYLYDKCDVHSNPKAIAAQQRYLSGLLNHINPYTQMAYKDDPYLVGMEINNEPCHTGTVEEVRNYINSMVNTMRATGYSRPIFYNVSHNPQVVSAYYSANIQGTTYQWYPIGLVNGAMQKGNFLPYVDQYPLPYRNLEGFSSKARLVYEFDPADILYSYMYPAMARSFRTAGFQWITQFAYDPLAIAYANTEYQTHYLNLLYTPRKALSMLIAAEVTRQMPREANYGTYPQDTLFANGFRVSYIQDLSEYNSKTKFFHSNSTQTVPVNNRNLQQIAGFGNSPIISYEGIGAYFLDRLEAGVWRLEIMPDATVISDPFAKPSLQKSVVTLSKSNWSMSIRLDDLGNDFTIESLTDEPQPKVNENTIQSITPGVYILRRKGIKERTHWNKDCQFRNMKVGEYVVPPYQNQTYQVGHEPAPIATANEPLHLEAEIAGPALPDSVLVFTEKTSFWDTHPVYYKMTHKAGRTYKALIPVTELNGNEFRYTLSVYHHGQVTSYPGGVTTTPLDWNHISTASYTTRLQPEGPCTLFRAGEDEFRLYCRPQWGNIRTELVRNPIQSSLTYRLSITPHPEVEQYALTRYIRPAIRAAGASLKNYKYLCIDAAQTTVPFTVKFVQTTGIAYSTKVMPSPQGIIKLPLSDFQQSALDLFPIAYPAFMPTTFSCHTTLPFRLDEVESVQLILDNITKTETIEIKTIWIE